MVDRPRNTPRPRQALAYPPAAQKLLDGSVMTDAPLTDEARLAIADDVRGLRNAIASSYGRDTLASRPGATAEERSSAFGQGHDIGDRLLVNWFREHPDGSRPGVFRPDFFEAHKALIAVTFPQRPNGAQRPRYERVLPERLRAYGIPDGFFPLHDTPASRAQLDRLALMVGVPPGYLLLQFRVGRVLRGRWQPASVHEWLRDMVGQALTRLGVEPFDARLTSSITPPPPSGNTAAAASVRNAVPPLDPATLAALNAVQRLQTAQARIGTIEQFFNLFGGRQEFEEHFGYTYINRRDGVQRRANLPWDTLQSFLRTEFRGMDAARLRHTTLLPGPRNTERIENLLGLIEPLLPDHGASCDRGNRALIARTIRNAQEQQTSLFGRDVGTLAPTEPRSR